MLSASQIKLIRSLQQKKFRDIHHLFTAEGSKLVLDLINSSFGIKEIFAAREWISENEQELNSKPFNVTPLPEKEMERITSLSSPSPVLAVVHFPAIPVLPENADDNFILVLDGISDPGNLGTIIRIADWFGIRTVITSENTVDLFNPKVVHASMGSIARVEVIPADIPEFLSRMPGITGVFGAFMTGENIYSMDLPSNGIIIIGNESNGISPEVSNLVKTRMHIPSYAGPGKESFPESLNAAVATAIICSEFRRRNKQ